MINPNWELEFHVHINAFQLVVGAIFAQNPIGKFDKLVMYASRLLNLAERNYTITKKETLAMVYALHNLDITYWVINLYFMLTTWPLCTWLIKHKFIAK